MDMAAFIRGTKKPEEKKPVLPEVLGENQRIYNGRLLEVATNEAQTGDNFTKME